MTLLGAIAEIEKREKAATPGPWRTIEPDSDCSAWFIARHSGDPKFKYGDKFYVLSAGSAKEDGSDASFVASARTDIPRLCAALKILTQVSESAVTSEAAISPVARSHFRNALARAEAALTGKEGRE